jgi:DNA polymerase III delta prime subunit
MNLVIHPTSQEQLDLSIKDLPQSLLLSGPRGIGLSTIALQIAGKQLAAVLRPQDKKEQADSERGTITVEMIRQLYDQTRAKRTTARIIVIDDADRMSRGASAAFLKLLEEPSVNTHFILTTHASQLLVPTIRSRVQELALLQITTVQTDEHLAMLGIQDKTKRAQLQFIAQGLPAELTRLANDNIYFTQRADLMSDARTLLLAKPYDKLTVIQKYQSDKDATLDLINSAITIARRSLSAKPQISLVEQLERLLQVKEHLLSNFNVRLQLTQLVL